MLVDGKKLSEKQLPQQLALKYPKQNYIFNAEEQSASKRTRRLIPNRTTSSKKEPHASRANTSHSEEDSRVRAYGKPQVIFPRDFCLFRKKVD